MSERSIVNAGGEYSGLIEKERLELLCVDVRAEMR